MSPPTLLTVITLRKARFNLSTPTWKYKAENQGDGQEDIIAPRGPRGAVLQHTLPRKACGAAQPSSGNPPAGRGSSKTARVLPQ